MGSHQYYQKGWELWYGGCLGVVLWCLGVVLSVSMDRPISGYTVLQCRVPTSEIAFMLLTGITYQIEQCQHTMVYIVSCEEYAISSVTSWRWGKHVLWHLSHCLRISLCFAGVGDLRFAGVNDLCLFCWIVWMSYV